MRPLASALSIALVSLVPAGCGAGIITSTPAAPAVSEAPAASVIPDWTRLAMQATPPQPIVYAAKPKTGIYAAEFYGSDLFAYRDPNKHNAKSVCKLAASYVNGFGVDASENLVIPNGYPAEVKVYRGPGLCGKLAGSFKDQYGQASDASTINALTGTIVVGNIEVSRANQKGNIAVCTLAKGCTRELKSKTITYYGGGVALAKSGDCWIASEDNASLSKAKLTYFKKCSGAGQTATGWKNAYYGGLIIDTHGNLISVDFNTPALWVYKGCNPACTVVGGPFPLEGASFYGTLSKKGTELALGDSQYGQVDVYAYSPAKLTYAYSFNKGLTLSENVEAAAVAPSL